MSVSTATIVVGYGITAVWTGNTGGSSIIYVSSCTMGRCLRGSPSCGRLINEWDII